MRSSLKSRNTRRKYFPPANLLVKHENVEQSIFHHAVSHNWADSICSGPG